MTANPKVTALVTAATAALKGQPPIGGTILVNLGADGFVYVWQNNVIEVVPQAYSADATVTASIDTLDNLESGSDSVLGDWWSGALKVDGDISIEAGGAVTIHMSPS